MVVFVLHTTENLVKNFMEGESTTHNTIGSSYYFRSVQSNAISEQKFEDGTDKIRNAPMTMKHLQEVQ